MSAMPRLDIRNARWDRFRDAVVVPAGVAQVVVSQDALESWAGRALDTEEAVETVIEESAMFSAIANTLPETDGIITITSGILNSRSWTVDPYDDGPEDSGPIYATDGELR